jgi:hypothetical protein
VPDLQPAEDSGGPDCGGHGTVGELADACKRDAGVVVVTREVLQIGERVVRPRGGRTPSGTRFSRLEIIPRRF